MRKEFADEKMCDVSLTIGEDFASFVEFNQHQVVQTNGP
jgi:hypothetical protein